MVEKQKKRLLAILAHPDDESFGMGGTLAKYAAEGVEVSLICATGGENGTVDPDLLNGYASIAELRADELRCAAEKLGLTHLTLAGYRDSGMAETEANHHPGCLVTQPIDYVAAHFAQLIREIRPHVVVTHDPIGNYKHPDHIACNQATTLAFELAGDPERLPETGAPAWKPQKLYYSTMPKRWFKLFVQVAPLFGVNPREFGRNNDIDVIDLIESGDFPIHTRINIRKHVETRNEASACHASQLAGGPPNTGFFGIILRLMGGYDGYMRAYPPAEDTLREKDFFEGVSVL